MMTIQETLKPREIEILRLMADELTNREIAEQLYIGVETVRWYAKQIYSKLDVSGREEASEKAQSLGLLNDAPIVEHILTKSKHNLPTQLTSFIGRESQVQTITELLEDTRLLTLTGPGGSGKTRLSIRVAETVLNDFDDGIHFVDLAPISDRSRVANAIANTLNIIESHDEPMSKILQRAIGNRRILLILDNFEHVIEAAEIVSNLLLDTPNIKIIVTSREPLHVSGEQIYPVPAMTLLEDGDLESSEAITLFVQRSQAVKPRFQIDETNQDAIIKICEQLDGMPLAIELAAGLSRFLTPDAILARMEDRFHTLKGGSRDAPTRQKTLRNTIDWSYNLLKDDEKILFARLAVFRGGRSLEAIEAVCSHDLSIDVFDGLAGLVDKSMVRQIEDELGEPRFIMLETIQEYAWECLEKRGDLDILRKRHAEYYADLATHAQTFLRQAGQEYWFPRLTIEHDNIRTALQWSLFGGDAKIGLRIVGALQDFWFYEGYHIEGQRWTEQAMEHLDDTDPNLQIAVLETAAWLSSGRQEIQQSLHYFEQALAIENEAGTGRRKGWLLVLLAQVRYDFSPHTQEDYEDALDLCEEGLSILRKQEDKLGLAQGLNALGNLHRVQGAFQLSQEAYHECLQVCFETGERRREMMSLSNLSKVAIGLGNNDDARQLAHDALQLSHQLKFNYMTALQLGVSSSAALFASGDSQGAARLLGASSILQETMNIRYQPNNMRMAEQILADVQEQLSKEEFQIAWEAGRKMSLNEAVEFALTSLNKN